MKIIKPCVDRPYMVVHTFSPSSHRQRQVDLWEAKASLACTVSSRQAKDT